MLSTVYRYYVVNYITFMSEMEHGGQWSKELCTGKRLRYVVCWNCTNLKIICKELCTDFQWYLEVKDQSILM